MFNPVTTSLDMLAMPVKGKIEEASRACSRNKVAVAQAAGSGGWQWRLAVAELPSRRELRMAPDPNRACIQLEASAVRGPKHPRTSLQEALERQQLCEGPPLRQHFNHATTAMPPGRSSGVRPRASKGRGVSA